MNLFCIKITLILCCFCLYCINSEAQARRGDLEFGANYGVHSGTQTILSLSKITEDSRYVNRGSSANYFADARRYIDNNVALGISAGNQWINYEFVNHGQKITIPSFPLAGSLTTVACELKCLYLNRKFCQLYGLVGLGARFFNVTSATPKDEKPFIILPNTQLTPLGLWFGYKLGFFVEFGFGYKGLLNSGLSYTFHTKPKHDYIKKDQPPEK